MLSDAPSSRPHKTSHGVHRIQHLAVAVTFFYDESRFQYLDQIATHFPHLARATSVWVVTNSHEPSQHDRIRESFAGCDVHIVVPNYLGHPHLLPWVHRDVFRALFDERPDITHFLYVEDDLEIRPETVDYWLEARDVLAPFGLIPSFLRVEYNEDGVAYSSDVYRREHIKNLPRLEDEEGYWVNIRYPYQGCYLMDRELFGEFLSSRTFSPDSGSWNIREKASQGLIYANVPSGCLSRAFIRLDRHGRVNPAAYVRHLPNNYVAQKQNKYGSIPADDIVSMGKFFTPTWVRDLRKLVSIRIPKRRSFMVRDLRSSS